MNWCRKRRSTKTNQEMERHKEFFRKQTLSLPSEKKASISKLTQNISSNSVEDKSSRNSETSFFKRDSPTEHQPIIYRSKKETEIAETLKEINRMGHEYGCENIKTHEFDNSEDEEQMVFNENPVAKKQKLTGYLFCSTNETDDEIFTDQKYQIKDEKSAKYEDKTVTDEDKSVAKEDSNAVSVVQVVLEVVENVCKKAENL